MATDSDHLPLNPSDMRRLRQLIRWSRNIRITGPYVTMENSEETLAVYVGVPPDKPGGRPGAGSLPLGQYQEMVFKMVSDNQNGYDFARLHGLL